ncbi:MAG: hypothetical protein WCO44_04310 [Bacteroidota bacterium]
MKIFLGLTNIASQLPLFAKGFNALGIETIVATSYKGKFTNETGVDVNLDDLPGVNFRYLRPRSFQHYLNMKFGKKGNFYRHVAEECDIFFFMWNSFHLDHADLKELKDAGKKIIVFHVGDDVRWKSSMTQEFQAYQFNPIEYPSTNKWGDQELNTKLEWLRKTEKYADLLYSAPNQAQLGLRPYYTAFVPIDLEYYTFSTNQRQNNPVVIHAPSLSSFKGTDKILKIVGKLKKTGLEFEFKLIQNLKHAEAINAYREADIIIDQILCPGGGKLSREGMALGRVVLSLMSGVKGYDQGIINEAPIVDVNEDTLFEELKKVIQDPERRRILGKQGREYVENYHDNNQICKNIITRLSADTVKDFDFKPLFFREEFVPESKKHTKVYNQWTKYVKECSWYHNFIPPGKRNGLEF